MLNNDPIPTHGPAQRRRLTQHDERVRESYREFHEKHDPGDGDVGRGR